MSYNENILNDHKMLCKERDYNQNKYEMIHNKIIKLENEAILKLKNSPEYIELVNNYVKYKKNYSIVINKLADIVYLNRELFGNQ